MTRRTFPFLIERPVPFTDFSSCHVAVTKAFAHANAPVYSSRAQTALSRETGQKNISEACTMRRSQQSGKITRGKIQIGRRVAITLVPPAGFSLSVSGRRLARYAPRTSASGFCSACKFHHVMGHPTLLAKIVLGEEYML